MDGCSEKEPLDRAKWAVYRKEGSEWQLAHRHADPLVRRITLEQAAALARV